MGFEPAQGADCTHLLCPVGNRPGVCSSLQSSGVSGMVRGLSGPQPNSPAPLSAGLTEGSLDDGVEKGPGPSQGPDPLPRRCELRTNRLPLSHLGIPLSQI